MKKMRQGTARKLILRKATQFRSTRAANTVEALSGGKKMSDRAATIIAVALATMHRKPYSSRTLAQAVNVCRVNKLVPKSVLVAAGFRGIPG